jgi:hypothetical protein
MTGLLKLIATIGRTSILPDDRAVHRFSRSAIPKDRGFALVRDPDRLDARRGSTGLGEHFARNRELRFPDLNRIVLDPSRFGIVLLKLALRYSEHISLAIK